MASRGKKRDLHHEEDEEVSEGRHGGLIEVDDNAEDLMEGDSNPVEGRRKTRAELRSLSTQLVERRAELEMGTDDARQETERLYLQTNKLVEPAGLHPRDYLVLAQTEAKIASVVQAQVSKVDVSSSHDNPTEFALKVKNWLSSNVGSQEADEGDAANVLTERERWRNLGALLPKFFAIAPGPSFLSGMVPTVAAVRQERKPRAKNDLDKGPAQEIKEMEERDGEGLAAKTVKQVELLTRQLDKLKQVPVMKLVANPDSMAQTVEHLFHVSFLVKEGLVQVFDDESDKGPILKSRKVQSDDAAMPDQDRVQAVVRLDFKTLRQVTEKFNITNPLIVSRQTSSRK